ncbi:MAG: low molecular weight protein-tyrosine-phosphatase [Burkholderiales bacterium]
MEKNEKTGILFVCMGNICRSPTAEAVFRKMAEEAGLIERIFIDSAGTHDYHIGSPPDERSMRAARGRGYDMSGLRARQVEAKDFLVFDHVLAMDRNNLAILKRIAAPGLQGRARLFMEFSRDFTDLEVPDPYYGGAQGFETVLDRVESASRGLLAQIAAAR